MSAHRFRIQTVAELTGVATSTLRAWERRYGVPAPARTESSYRMYRDLDIATIRQMRRLIDSGVNAGETKAAASTHAVAEELRHRHLLGLATLVAGAKSEGRNPKSEGGSLIH